MKIPKFKKGDQVVIKNNSLPFVYTVVRLLHKFEGFKVTDNYWYALERDGIGASADEDQLVKV